MDLKAGDIDVQVARDIAREALDLDLAQNMLEDAALVLHARRNTDQLDRHRHAHHLVHRNPLQVDVQQLALDRLMLPVDDHRLGNGRAFDVQVEDGVVTGVGVQNLGDDPGVDRYRDRILSGAINNGGNLAGDANAARRILVELALAGSCDHCFNRCCCHNEFSFRARKKVNSCQLLVVC